MISTQNISVMTAVRSTALMFWISETVLRSWNPPRWRGLVARHKNVVASGYGYSDMLFFKCHQMKQHNSLFLFCSVLVGMVRDCWHPHIQWFPKFFYMRGKFWIACLEVVLIKTCWVLDRKWGWTQHASLSRLIAQKVISWTIFGNFGLQKDTLRVFCGCMRIMDIVKLDP